MSSGRNAGRGGSGCKGSELTEAQIQALFDQVVTDDGNIVVDDGCIVRDPS